MLRADSLQVTFAYIRSIRISSSAQQHGYFILELLLEIVQTSKRFPIIAMVDKLEYLLEVSRSRVRECFLGQYLRVALTLQE